MDKRTKSAEGIWKSPAGHYVARWREPSGAERSKTFTKYEDAKAHRTTMLESRNRGNYVSPKSGKVTLETRYKDFVTESRSLTAATRSLYEQAWRRYIARDFGRWQIAAIERKDVQRWIGDLEDRGVKPTGVEVAHRLLRRLLAQAVKDGVLGRNPASGVDLEQLQGRPRRILTKDEVVRIADVVDSRYRALVLLLATAGLRVGEAGALRVGDVDLLRRKVTIDKATAEVNGTLVPGATKTKKSRTVSIAAFVADELAPRVGSSDRSALLFTAPDGGPLRRSNFRLRIWVPALKAAGIERPWPRVHDLRHSAVALAIEAGAHPKQIQEMVGHSKITTTLDTYGHLFPTLGDRLAEALDAGFRQAQDRAADFSRTFGESKVVALPRAEGASVR